MSTRRVKTGDPDVIVGDFKGYVTTLRMRSVQRRRRSSSPKSMSANWGKITTGIRPTEGSVYNVVYRLGVYYSAICRSRGSQQRHHHDQLIPVDQGDLPLPEK